jgi:alpha-tubulin suppressor-like RCC1 family protein
LLKNGRLFAWGLGADGQLGDGTFDTRWQPVEVGGDLRGEPITRIAGTIDTLLAVSRNGDVFVWGQNEYGQLPNCAEIQVL